MEKNTQGGGKADEPQNKTKQNKTKQNKTKQNKTKQYELFEPVKVFIALMLVVIMWLLPVAFPQAEDSSDKKPNTDSPFIVPKAGVGWTCFDNPNCWEWACAEVIRGGCLRYEQKCTCTHEGGGGGPSYSPPTISHTFNCSVPGWGDWCIGALSIELSASDPQNASLIISGDVNGNPSTGSGQVFTCTENPCTIDLSEGAGNVNYKVDASTGLSDSDSAPYYLDVTTPQIDGSISGTSGTLGWFTTQTSVTASASDFNSGIASLEVNVNNAGYSPYADTTFTDGVHTIQFRAYDNAGNLTETAIQTIMVDTITPSLSLQVDGTRGQNDFYTNSVTVTPIASDSGSGINKIEASVDNGIWTVINSPLFFADGNHSYQIRVTDNAGNVTETPVQSLYIDASPAVIDMLDDSLILGDGLFYSIEDSQSGLSELRVVIKDNEGKYKSITWVENLDRANKYKDSVWWDGVFGDGTYPTPGIYFIALKVINGAGVETIRTATIEVPVVKTAAQENLPALVLPPSTPEETATALQVVQPSAPQIFGNNNNPFTGTSIQTSFSANSTTIPTQSTNTTSNVLWGGAAAAMLGATLAEWQRQREEEAARLAALRNSGGGEEEEDRPRKKTAGQIAYEKKQQQKRIVAESQALMNQKKATQQTQNAIAKNKNLNKAEAVMNAVKPVTPYVVSSYLDKEEETWLKGNESQRAWAAVNAQEVEALKEQSLLQTFKDWYQKTVDKFLRQPPPWLSVSYQQPFSLGNLFADEMIYPQFSARNGFETWVYQSASIEVNVSSKLTSNPSGWADFNSSNGRITFKGKPDADGRRTNYFVQPFALSAGQISVTPLVENPQVKRVDVSTYDFDVLSLKNWMSLKVSQATGLSTSTPLNLPTGETVEKTDSIQLQATVSIHRWPRILVVAGVAIYVWEAAGVGVALKAGAEALVSVPLFQQMLQIVPQ